MVHTALTTDLLTILWPSLARVNVRVGDSAAVLAESVDETGHTQTRRQ